MIGGSSMAQVCQMCGKASIDDDLERCPRCQNSLLVSEGLPPGRGKARPSMPPQPRSRPVDEPQLGSPPVPQKRPRRPRSESGPPSPPLERPQPLSPESSDFGRVLNRLVGDSAPVENPATPPRAIPEVDPEGPERAPAPRSSPAPAPKPLPPVSRFDREEGHGFASPGNRIEMTEAPRGLDIRKFNIPTRSYEIELFCAPNNWVPLFQLIGMDKSPVFGRSHKMLDQGMETMAERHVRFKNTIGGVEIEALDSFNGIYLQISRPVTLSDGTRFRIGDYVLEYRDAEPGDPVAPKVADDGERFVAQDVIPLAYLDFLRPNDEPGVRFPILKATSTVLGRGGTDHSGAPRQVDVPLLNDKLVSGRHAEIRLVNDHFVLEDLKSKNGTFIQIRQNTVVGDGATLCLGKVYLRVVQIKSLQTR